MAHALLAPSSMDRIISCPASLAEADGKIDKGSRFAWEGTAAHTLHAWCLEQALPAISFIGTEIEVIEDDVLVATFEVDEEMAGYVQESVDKIYEYMSLDPAAELYVEIKVSFAHVVDFDDATGTSDVVILLPTLRKMFVIDLKYGKGVKVDAWDYDMEGATPNAQMAAYGLGALRYFTHYSVDEVTLAVHQPRIGNYSDHTLSVDDLEMWGRNVMKPGCNKALSILEMKRQNYKIAPENYTPNQDNCRFCKGKANCPALKREVQNAIGFEFEDLDAVIAELDDKPTPIPLPTEDEELDALYPKLDMISEWCDAVYKRLEQRALEGVTFTNCYLKRGRKGNREWIDKAAAEAALKSMRFKNEDIFNMKLHSPAQIEKLLKGQPKRIKTMSTLITQRDGKFALAAVGEPGEPYIVEVVEFDDLDAIGADDLA